MKDAVQAIAADMRAAMIEELRAGLNANNVPPHAMTFEELFQESGGSSRDRLRLLLNKRLAAGEWKRERIGTSVKYWKVE
jgi:hypothetical protein